MDSVAVVKELLATFSESWRPLFCRPVARSRATEWGLLAVIAAPHLLHAWVWLLPKRWRSVFGAQATGAFALISTFLKLVIMEVLVLWVWSTREAGICLDLSAIQLWQWMAFLLLLAFGQALIIGTIQAVGLGASVQSRLGEAVDDSASQLFPYNVTPFPQYVGSVFNVWAVALLLYNQYPAGQQHQVSVMLLTIYATILWALTAGIEAFL